MNEDFRPIGHANPKGFFSKMTFFLRMLLDFQLLTIYLDLKKQLPIFKGEVLDVGCGESPYKFLLMESHTNYHGIDTIDSHKFDYDNDSITHFNGKDIPFSEDKFDYVLCTEVLEHVFSYQQLINEIFRVMKKGSKGVFTIPWSARYHYIPYDYYRYTPAALQEMFSSFANVQITPRGTDLTSIVAKIIVLFFRNAYPTELWRFVFLPFWIILSPILLISIFIGYLSVFFRIGSDSDPLGYTILVQKR
ncbi:MAG: class I SAM-dependent methyltransferase [Bacteroidota bacterium]